ncbi:hypothetical protein C8A05DRAFT_35093 [Staphylotrichum tortipilum]|uniref:Uncharacterized protein n=1 Tax=Staphylotrichum tortipilum TaxID=2831512 RepID=A0AAN6MHZ1_9PEZI|nr:hypothetical protein C8A05DRAFT_35093 [Staphylotrichum longicolle]
MVLFMIVGADVVMTRAEVDEFDVMVLFGSSVRVAAGGVVTVVRLANGGVTTVVFLRRVEAGAVPDANPVPVGKPVGTKEITVVGLPLGVVLRIVEFSRGRLVGGSGVESVVNDVEVNSVALGAKLGRGNTAMVEVVTAGGVAMLVASTTVEESIGGDETSVTASVDDATSGRFHEELRVPEVIVVVIVSVRTTGDAVPVPL